ncbi:hypothetical protein FHR81_001520 [Actinoalloteichus hoggarensis]|uniref:Uncharacterized protein n=1 Tax=Actinoalloteichus hoggarensis TaxID=1470176 RepID=A0A221W0G5_9PSEU|nr:hypothetical protein AHOG_08035 [Actinoalloteichus hoggarensis]MBB5920490.1 hypothetical protein [Actinoalloteichus hoggarensis]
MREAQADISVGITDDGGTPPQRPRLRRPASGTSGVRGREHRRGVESESESERSARDPDAGDRRGVEFGSSAVGTSAVS